MPRRRRAPRKRFVRIGRGLWRYVASGVIYLCRRVNGRNTWRNLQTTHCDQAMAIAASLRWAESQNGHHEVEVVETAKVVIADTAWLGAVTTPASEAIHRAASGVPTLRQLADQVIEECQHLEESTRMTRACYLRVLEKHLDFDLEVTALTLSRLRTLRGQLTKGRKPSTTNDILGKGLRPLLALAVERGILEKSPMDALKPLRKGKSIRLQPSWPQAQHLVEEIQKSSPGSGLLITFMLYFGVGQAEVKHLRGEHVDLEGGQVNFYRKKTQKYFAVPIYVYAKTLMEQLEKQGMLKTGRPVFAWHNPRKALESACARLDLPKYSPRALRRTFIIRCLEQGVDPRVLADWQGHEDAKLILSIYGKYVSKEHTQAQAAKLG